jgi:hypothetical protein
MVLRSRESGAVVALGILAILAAGCATLGPAYQKVGHIPADMAIVYIYRPGGIGAAVTYDVKVGETVITSLSSGGYYPYLAKPGELELWARTESKSSVTLDVKPGQTYYVKGTIGIGFLVGRPRLQIVPEEEALKEIVECKLISDKVEEKK